MNDPLPFRRKSETPAETIRDDYEVTNALGTVFMTTSERDLAVQFVRDNLWRFPGLVVDHVTVTQQRHRAYRPRPVIDVINDLRRAQ